MQGPKYPPTPREQMLLKELEELLESARETTADLEKSRQSLGERESEIRALRRDMIELKEENQHLREVLQTWRMRLDSVLSQLKSIN
jgi:chromosome segregation ATPase